MFRVAFLFAALFCFGVAAYEVAHLHFDTIAYNQNGGHAGFFYDGDGDPANLHMHQVGSWIWLQSGVGLTFLAAALFAPRQWVA